MISLPQFHKSAPAPGCGTCTLCCDVSSVAELGKPAYARCQHLTTKCDIYETRPDQCRVYRCAWHLSLLGDRVDRRPDNTGVVLQFEQNDGRWYLVLYEAVPGAAFTDKARYLADMVLKHKRVQHLSFGSPALRIVPFGSDVPVDFPVSDIYENFTAPTGSAPTKLEGNALVFSGNRRPLLMPSKVKASSGTPPSPTAATTSIP
jgi:hypothetical protein